eukprot:jgi/Picre1/34500/NNA_001968.t1
MILSTSQTTKDACRPRAIAKDVLTSYYDNYNEKRIDKVLELFDDDVEYQDLIYQDAFKGKQELEAYFKKIGELVPKDIRFVVDDITEGDENKCGVLWHVEIESEKEGMVELPFSRGVSFYRLNNQGRIIFARDIVESPFKPGESSLGGITAAGLMLAFATGYIGVVLLSDLPPGSPAYMTDPKDLERILHESYNFFYVNMFMAVRSTLSMVLSVVIARLSHDDSPLFGSLGHMHLLFLRGASGAMAMTCFYVSVQKLLLSEAVALLFLNPALVAVLAFFFLGETITVYGVLGVLVVLSVWF